MEIFKKLTEEIKSEMLNNPKFSLKDFVENTKATTEEDTGTFECVISTPDQDRQGEIVDINGWDLKNYLANPIVLWAHDYHSLPIGIADEIKVDGKQLVAKGRFASAEANPFAQQVRKLYDAGIIKTTSVGFIAKEMQGNVITQAELLEFSFVPVPANPYALSQREAKELGIDAMVAKSFNIEIKSEGEEDTKNTDDQKDEKTNDTDTQVTTDNEAEEKGMKEGRTISDKNRQKIQSAIDALKAASVALDELLTMSEPAKANTEENRDGETSTKERSNPDLEAFNKWFQDRTLLKAINKATSRALQEFNKIEK